MTYMSLCTPLHCVRLVTPELVASTASIMIGHCDPVRLATGSQNFLNILNSTAFANAFSNQNQEIRLPWESRKNSCSIL